MGVYNKNFYLYGEVGDRLGGIRESEVAKYSAKQLTNLVVTELGNVKAAKQYNVTNNVPREILKVVDTPYSYYIVIDSKNVVIYDKNNDNGFFAYPHGMGIFKDVCMIGKEILILIGTNSKTFSMAPGGLTEINYFQNLIFPVANKKDVKMDLWQKITVGTQKICQKMISYTNPKLTLTNGQLYTPNTNILISRVYVTYKGAIDYDGIEVAEGQYFAVMQEYETVANGNQYYIGNTGVTFGVLATDAKYNGQYFTTVSGGNTTGEMIFGQLRNIIGFTHASFFQNRLVLFYDDVMYFSRQNEYLDFRNPQIPTYNSEPFFVKPTPIDNNQPVILSTISDEGLYILTDRGVYLSGYRTPVHAGNLGQITVISNVPTKGKGEIIGENLFFLTPDNSLKCVQLGYQTTVISYNTYNVEKYSVVNDITSMTKHTVNDIDYILCTTSGGQNVYLYEILGENNNFRRVSKTIPHVNIIGFRDKLFINNGAGYQTYKFGNKNMPKLTLFLNAPSINTQKGGSYLNDSTSTVEKVAIKFLNQDREAIKKVYINGKPMVNLGANIEDRYTTYMYTTHFPIQDGFKIEIETNENNKALEIQGTDIFVKEVGV